MGDHAITLLKHPGSGQGRTAPAFDELFTAHQRKVFLAAYRVTGSVQDAEDVLQTVFLRQLQRPERAAGSMEPEAWLCRSAINAGIDLLRSRARVDDEPLVPELHAAAGAGVDADSEARQEEIRRLLRRALTQLDPGMAEVFALRYFEEYSNPEIAALLDTSPNTIAVTLHRARARLQDLLGELSGDDR